MPCASSVFLLEAVVHSSAATTIGHPSRKHQDWFDENDEEIKLLLEEKHCVPIIASKMVFFVKYLQKMVFCFKKYYKSTEK